MTSQEAIRILDKIRPGEYLLQPKGGLWIWHEYLDLGFPHKNWVCLGNINDPAIERMLIELDGESENE